jgi:hypothetical protein
VSVTLKERTVGDRKKANDMGANPETHTRWEKIKEGGGTDRSNTRQQQKKGRLGVCQFVKTVRRSAASLQQQHRQTPMLFSHFLFFSPFPIDFKKTLDFSNFFPRRKKQPKKYTSALRNVT